MSLAEEYRRQYPWRAWPAIFDALPPLAGRTVLDLGCGVGDQASDLVARGARVIGFDVNEELLAAARSRGLANAEFRAGDLRHLPGVEPADGIWCSFAAAYFPDLPSVLGGWGHALRSGGWIALTEIDDLFAHGPVRARTKEALDAYTRDALTANRYDFQMGRKLAGHLVRSGYTVERELTLDDRELAFHGPAAADVLDAWRNRFERLKLLRDYSGAEFAAIRDDFLGCLTRDDHRSGATVRFCLARRTKPPEGA